ncbi:MAG: permease [Thermocrinis sp.]|uniref:permease n=1 Tax=Thermocrinis sp. TaxID=2024383 RepID=UPI003C01E9AE
MEFFKNFYSYLVEIVPFFVLAMFVSAFLKAMVKPSLFLKFLSKRRSAPIFTALLGAVSPMCSCSMLPFANFINSYSKGYGPVLAFLITAPTLSPVILLLTYGLFGLDVSIYRLVGSLAYALLVAYSVGYFLKKPPTLQMKIRDSSSKRSAFLEGLREQLPVVKYLLIGIAIASLIKTFTPTWLTASLSKTPLAYPLISLVAVPIYVCSGEDVVLGRAMVDVGFTTGQAITFMLGSSGVCLPTIFALFSFLPKKVVFAYSAGWFMFSILTGLVYDTLFFK